MSKCRDCGVENGPYGNHTGRSECFDALLAAREQAEQQLAEANEQAGVLRAALEPICKSMDFGLPNMPSYYVATRHIEAAKAALATEAGRTALEERARLVSEVEERNEAIKRLMWTYERTLGSPFDLGWFCVGCRSLQGTAHAADCWIAPLVGAPVESEV